MMHKVHRYHDICAGHRVVGHEGKCQHLHGHNYRIHFTCEGNAERGQLDSLGRVIDFSVVKERLCMWLEEHWDHKFLHWTEDPVIDTLRAGVMPIDRNAPIGGSETNEHSLKFIESLVALPFNPTAENLAEYLVEIIGPCQLKSTGIILTEVLIEETAKCHVSYRLDGF